MKCTQVAVYGRLKPCPQDLSQDFVVKFGGTEDQLIIPPNSKDSPKKKRYRFKKVFDESFSQEEIFNAAAKPVINDVFSGYDGMIFTYGQTGSGKTYTMAGNTQEPSKFGLIPRAIQEIFRTKKKQIIRVTYCEIYNERVHDLIGSGCAEANGSRGNQLRYSKISMFRDLSVHEVEEASEALQLFIRGNERKTVTSAESGFSSSRSHVIFSIRLEFPCTEDGILCFSPVLYLVDLASTENRDASSGNPLESRNVNLSLLYLEHVMLALRRPRKVLIPYRNSRMISFLKNTLGGNSITAVITTLSSAANDMQQTVQSCQFAERLGQITSIAYPCETIIPSKKVFDPVKDLKILEKQYKFLKTQLNVFVNNQLPEDELDDDEKAKCAERVEKFIAGKEMNDFPDCDVRKTIYCFQLMRETILKNGTITETPMKLDLSESSLTSANDLRLEASKGISENKFEENNSDGTLLTEFPDTTESEEKDWEQGDKSNDLQNTTCSKITKSESTLSETVPETLDGSVRKLSEEYVLIQKKIENHSELVLCIVKSKEKEVSPSQSKS